MSISPEENNDMLDSILEKNSRSEDKESGLAAASNDLMDVIDIESSYGDPDIDTLERQARGQSIITEFEKFKDQYATQVPQNAINSLINSLESKEEYYRLIASQLYAEIHKSAKKFLKYWCRINQARQVWSNPFEKEFNAKFLKQNSEFIPQVYSLSVKFPAGEMKPLVHMAKTAREATINGAKLLGFDDSNERRYTLAKFPPDVIQVLFTEAKYLKEAEQIYIYQEQRGQILNRHYVPDSIRDKWKIELEAKFAVKNGVI